jgi:hypothetical protein
VLLLLIGAMSALGRPAFAQAEPPCFGEDVTIEGIGGPFTGTNGSDVILGTDGAESIDGKGGNDIIHVTGTAIGSSGNDPVVWALNGLWDNGTYTTHADGGTGNDRVIAHNGTAIGGDQVAVFGAGGVGQGDSGNDIVSDYATFTQAPADPVTLKGGNGKDTCYTNGDDTLISCERVRGISPI